MLVFALVFSLCVGAFAGNFDDYKDADQLDEKYVEAADYLIAAGVIVGNGDGTLAPKDNLLREQAAKLVAYAMLGQAKADALAADTDPFDDVAKDYWAAGYISYCQKQNIINGDGDGKFRPEDTVTGYEFGKMMLCALGYGANGEYTGDNWSTNVGTDGLVRGLYADVLDAASNSEITREQAFQIMFNACQMIPVQYNDSFKTYFAGSPMYGDPNLPNNDRYYELRTGYDSLGEIKFGLSFDPDTDEYGYPGHYWSNKKGPQTDFYRDGEVIDTLNGREKDKDVTKEMDNNYTVILNNGKVTDFGKKPAAPGEEAEDMTAVEYAIDKAAKGATVELLDCNQYYDENGKADYIIITEEYLAKVTKVTPAKGPDAASITMTVFDVSATGTKNVKVSADDYEGVTEFAKDDYVLIVPTGTAFTTPISIEKADPTTAAVEAYTTDPASVTFEGERNEYAGTAKMVEATYQFKDATYNFYFNSNGFVIGSEKEKVAEIVPDYIFVETVAYQTEDTDELYGDAGSDGARIRGYLADGSKVVLDLATEFDPIAEKTVVVMAKADGTKDTVPIPTTGSIGIQDKRVYAYTTDSDGKVILSLKTEVKVGPDTYEAYNVAEEKVQTVKVVPGKAEITVSGGGDAATALYANADTNLVVVGKDGSATTYTGYANFPGDKKDGMTYTTVATSPVPDNTTACAYIFYARKGNILTDIVVVNAKAAPVKETLTLIYTGSHENRPNDKGEDKTFYSFYNVANGEIESYYGSEPAKAGAVIIATVKDGEYTAESASYLKSEAAISENQSDFIVTDSTYYITADTKVIDLTGDARPGTVEPVEGGTTEVGQKVILVVGKDAPTADKITYLIITTAAPEPTV